MPHIIGISITKRIQWWWSPRQLHWSASSNSSTSAGYVHRPGIPNPRARVSSMHHLIHAYQRTKDIVHLHWYHAPTLTSMTTVGNTERGVNQYFFSIVNYCQLDSSQLKTKRYIYIIMILRIKDNFNPFLIIVYNRWEKGTNPFNETSTNLFAKHQLGLWWGSNL